MDERDYPTYDEIKDAQRQLAHNYSCSRDHCTPEERAVINAAVRDRQAEVDPNGNFDRMVQARCEFRETVTQLLATRSKSEVRE